MKARPTVFFAGDCALETRIIYGGVRGGAPRRGGRGRRSALEGEASPFVRKGDPRLRGDDKNVAGMTRMWRG